MRFPTLTGRRQGEDLTPRVEALERRIKALEVEWDEWYDKYRRLYARLAKRVERAQTDEPEAPLGGIAPPTFDARSEAVRRAFARMGHGGNGS